MDNALGDQNIKRPLEGRREILSMNPYSPYNPAWIKDSSATKRHHQRAREEFSYFFDHFFRYFANRQESHFVGGSMPMLGRGVGGGDGWDAGSSVDHPIVIDDW